MDKHERMSKIIEIMFNVNQLRLIKPEEKIQFERQCSQYINKGKHSKGEIRTSCRILHYDFNDDYAKCFVEFNKII
jgi:hypothetical protein